MVYVVPLALMSQAQIIELTNLGFIVMKFVNKKVHILLELLRLEPANSPANSV